MTVTPGLQRLLERKLARVWRLLNDSAVSGQAVLRMQKRRHLTEISIHARGDHMLTGLGEGDTWPESVAAAVDKVTQQAQKLKERWDTRRRRGQPARLVPAVLEAQAANSRPSPRRRPRVGRYPIKPMTVDDAAVKLERSGEAFVVFRNALDDALLIAYRRKDGRVALINPEA
jgi:putative sigma-54 modulation protein